MIHRRRARPGNSQTIITLILRLRDTQGVTAMLATHRLQDAFGLANYRFDPDSGRVVHVKQNGNSQSAPRRLHLWCCAEEKLISREVRRLSRIQPMNI